jgi:hypothetical protein
MAHARDDEDDEPTHDEQDLLVVLKLSNRQMGTHQERADLEALADDLEALVRDAEVGEYDGDELGGGECTLFFCGTDIDKLLGVLLPALKRSPLARGAHVVRMVDGAPRRTPV